MSGTVLVESLASEMAHRNSGVCLSLEGAVLSADARSHLSASSAASASSNVPGK